MKFHFFCCALDMKGVDERKVESIYLFFCLVFDDDALPFTI